MRWLAVLGVVGATILGAPAIAQGQQIAKDQSLLALNLPGIPNAREQYQYLQSSNYNYEVYYAIQIANGANYPRGQFFYTVLAPDRIWTDQLDIDEQWIRSQSTFLKDRQIRNVQSVRGGGSEALRTARFQTDQSECVAVSYVIGSIGVSADLSAGSPQASVRGFYCAKSGDALSDDDIRDVLSGIQIGKTSTTRASLVPPRPGVGQAQRREASLEGRGTPVAVVWEGFINPMTGTIVFSDTAKAQGDLEFLSTDIQCRGTWRRSATQGPPPRDGFWGVTCDNGVRATGQYSANTAGRGDGEGIDSEGRPVKFSFGR